VLGGQTHSENLQDIEAQENNTLMGLGLGLGAENKGHREDAEQSVDETSGLKAEGNGPRRDIAAPPEKNIATDVSLGVMSDWPQKSFTHPLISSKQLRCYTPTLKLQSFMRFGEVVASKGDYRWVYQA